MIFKSFRGTETGSTEGTGEGFKRVRERGVRGVFKEVIEMRQRQLRERVNIRFNIIEMKLEGLKEEVIFDFKTLKELRVEEDRVTGLMMEDMMDIINNTRGKEKEMGVELMIGEKDEDTIILEVDFEMFTIGNTTKGVTKNTGRVIKFAIIIEFIKIGFTDIRGFTMFRVDKNSGKTVAFNLNITRVGKITSENNIRIGESFKKIMKEDIFGHLSFKRRVTGEIIMKRGESIMNRGDFMMESMRVKSGRKIFKKIRLKVR